MTGSTQIDVTAEELLQLEFERRDPEGTGCPVGLELDEQVDVTVVA